MRFLTCPQQEQRLVEGNQREAIKRSPPALATFVFKNCKSCPMAASATARASFRLAIIRSRIEVFDPNGSARMSQFGGELVLHVASESRDLLMLECYLHSLLLIVLTENGSARFWIFGFLLLAELTLQLAEFLEMECQGLLVLKPASIGNHGSRLQAYVHPHHPFRSLRKRFLDLDLNTHIPPSCLTR